MYPNLYYAVKDLFGLDWKFLHFVNSFGFFVAISFILAAITLTMELRRKEAQGLLHAEEETIIVGKAASPAELLINFILGFVIGYKLIGLFTTSSPWHKILLIIYFPQKEMALPASLSVCFSRP